MTRHTDKGIRFEKLISKADDALANNYCIEASSIYYAIIEERFYSLFDLIGVSINQRDEKIYHCIQRILNIIDNGHYIVDPNRNSNDNALDADIRALIITHFDRNLLVDIDSWRDKRNSVTHDFAKIDIDYDDIASDAKEGQALLRQLLSSQQRFKKQLT